MVRFHQLLVHFSPILTSLLSRATIAKSLAFSNETASLQLLTALQKHCTFGSYLIGIEEIY